MSANKNRPINCEYLDIRYFCESEIKCGSTFQQATVKPT